MKQFVLIINLNLIFCYLVFSQNYDTINGYFENNDRLNYFYNLGYDSILEAIKYYSKYDIRATYEYMELKQSEGYDKANKFRKSIPCLSDLSEEYLIAHLLFFEIYKLNLLDHPALYYNTNNLEEEIYVFLSFDEFKNIKDSLNIKHSIICEQMSYVPFTNAKIYRCIKIIE